MDIKKKVQNLSSSVDKLSRLPDELLIRILSLLPTKAAAAMCVLSRRIRCVFPWIDKSLDFDDSPISHCSEHPYAIELFLTFTTFVDTILHAYKSPYLTRFSLRVRADFEARYFLGDKNHKNKAKECFPDLKSAQILAWISTPLNRCGLRELDLRIQVRETNDVQLPPEIFTYETLEVLKLDVNLCIDQVSNMSSFRLPNLKLFHLCTSLGNSADMFVTRLVSSCPLLEELTVKVEWTNNSPTTISSPSLRRLCLKVLRSDDVDLMNPVLVEIHTPNLEYFDYYDDLASSYSFSNMHSLVKADIFIVHNLQYEYVLDQNYVPMRNLIRPFSNVQHLSLLCACTENLMIDDEENELSLFPYLTHLELGNPGYNTWNPSLLSLLNGFPVLETLIFPEGLAPYPDIKCSHYEYEYVKLERQFFRTPLAIKPVCCRFHLKRVVIEGLFGNEYEIDIVSVRKQELVMCVVSVIVASPMLKSG